MLMLIIPQPAIASESPWPKSQIPTSDQVQKFQVFADQFRNSHAERPNDFLHAKPYVATGQLYYDRPVSMTRFAAAGEGRACTAITCHGQMEHHCHARTMLIDVVAYSRHIVQAIYIRFPARAGAGGKGCLGSPSVGSSIGVKTCVLQ